MSNFLVRGVSERVTTKVRRAARLKNLSVNHILVKYINEGAEREEKEKEALQRHAEASKELRQMRKEMYKKYGMMEDSWKLIREDRDSH